MNDQNDPTSAAIMPRPSSAMALSSGETSAIAQSAREEARIMARHAMARRFPRNVLDFRDALLTRCKSSAFAEIARYSVPRGAKQVQGPSIRFVEEALRAFKNVEMEADVTSDDPEKRTIRVSGTDLESNLGYGVTVVVAKTMERKQLKEGERPIASRINSQGQQVYILPAGEDEINMRQNALVSKATRVVGLRVLPGDVVEEAQAVIIATKRETTKRDPAAALKKLVDAFSELGIRPSALEEWLGGPLAAATPANLDDLRDVYVAVREGHVSWIEVMAAKRGGGQAEDDAPPKRADADDVRRAAAEAQAKIDAAKAERLARKAAPPPPAKAEAKPEPPAPKHDPTTHDGAEPPPGWEPSKG